MNKNNFLKTLSLFILLSSLNLCASQEKTAEPIETQTSYWRQYAPQLLQDAGDYAASWIPQSVNDRINSWSTKKKLAIAGAIIASLAAVYNRDVLRAFVNNAIEKQRQEKFEHDVWFDTTNIEIGLDPIIKQKGSKEFSMALERDLQAYYDDLLMRKNPKEAELIYNEVVKRLTDKGLFNE